MAVILELDSACRPETDGAFAGMVITQEFVNRPEIAGFVWVFIESLCHTKGTWAGKPFELIDWQEQIIRDIFGTLKPNGYRQFNTAYVEIPKKQGKSELAAAVALLLTCGSAACAARRIPRRGC